MINYDKANVRGLGIINLYLLKKAEQLLLGYQIIYKSCYCTHFLTLHYRAEKWC